ncbi:MAG: hypothetical protein ABIT83_21295 [Massilia sp.]
MSPVPSSAPSSAPSSVPSSVPSSRADTFDAQAAGALWNPGAAALWSLLFTPAFGAWVHMHNWRLLGQPVEAARARRWLHASIAMLGLQIVTAALNERLGAEALLIHPAGMLFMLLWYVAAARAQVALVKARFGRAYPRRHWDAVVLPALLGAGCYAVLKAVTAWLFVTLT